MSLSSIKNVLKAYHRSQQQKALTMSLCFCLLFSCNAISKQENTLPYVDKKTHHIPVFDTFNGKQIKNVNLGWESYGELNADKSNAILITHYFTGNSHAAGKYSSEDAAAGYWDSIIGPGKAIDTNRFFVLSMDSFANLSVHDPMVVTTGPASINPETGKPYGLSFPVITMRDMVNAQKSLLDSLGIDSLYAVAGPSMGSMQAIEWASAYPNKVPRLISVIGSSFSDAWTTAALEQWSIPIRLDPKWNNGDYYGKEGPKAGLTAALMFITQVALTPEYFNNTGKSLNHSPLELAPLQDIRASHKINQWLLERASTRSEKMDANSLLYLVRACQLFMAGQQSSWQDGLRNIKAKTLFLPATQDLLLMPYHAHDTHQQLKTLTKQSELSEIPGALGHLEGVIGIQKHAETIAEFLSN